MPLAKDVHTATSTTSAVVGTERARTAGSGRSASQPTWESDAEIHLIRLCLDLQLDAMLLSLGAAASQSRREAAGATASLTRPATDLTSEAVDAPPWHRWVREDVEMVITLAEDVMSGGASLPHMLGSDLDQAVPAAAIDNLMARFESMAALLADVLPAGGSRSPAPYRTHAQEALARYQDRLHELRRTRLDHTPPRGLPLTPPVEHPPVPGEWLG